jgi:methylthioribose-1-phosphate isomerase
LRVAVRLTLPDSSAANYAFDVTPARLVTARGICPVSREGLLELFPERGRRVMRNSADPGGAK